MTHASLRDIFLKKPTIDGEANMSMHDFIEITFTFSYHSLPTLLTWMLHLLNKKVRIR